MKEKNTYYRFFRNAGDSIGIMIRFLLNILLALIIIALIIGIVKSGIDMFHGIHQPLDAFLQNILLDVVFIVALIEIAITIIGYLKDGRVHVRYIVDTVLIIMLNEIVSSWFRHAKLTEAIALSVIVVALASVRVLVLRLGPQEDTRPS